MTRLGINIDHIATIRNARGSTHPDPLLAAKRVDKFWCKFCNYSFKRRQKTY